MFETNGIKGSKTTCLVAQSIVLHLSFRSTATCWSTTLAGTSAASIAGVALDNGRSLRCRSVVITTGTFLRGVLHVGSKTRPAGRMPSSLASKVMLHMTIHNCTWPMLTKASEGHHPLCLLLIFSSARLPGGRGWGVQTAEINFIFGVLEKKDIKVKAGAILPSHRQQQGASQRRGAPPLQQPATVRTPLPRKARASWLGRCTTLVFDWGASKRERRQDWTGIPLTTAACRCANLQIKLGSYRTAFNSWP